MAYNLYNYLILSYTTILIIHNNTSFAVIEKIGTAYQERSNGVKISGTTIPVLDGPKMVGSVPIFFIIL